jgi:hypothetical protein
MRRAHLNELVTHWKRNMRFASNSTPRSIACSFHVFGQKAERLQVVCLLPLEISVTDEEVEVDRLGKESVVPFRKFRDRDGI